MAQRHFYFRADELVPPRLAVTQLMERIPGDGLRNAPYLVGRSRIFTSIEELQRALEESTGDTVRLTKLEEDQKLPSSPSSPS